ncbi:MAG: type II secretion system F family protein [Propionibacteriales bacterium]|nr:type II secretion system F family protein [Propionibacteriales bacterium]
MSLLAASAAGAVVLLAGRPRSRPRSLHVVTAAGDSEEQSVLRRARPLLSCLAFLAGWTVLGGAAGLVAGALAAASGWRVLGNVESPAAVRRRETLERELPMAVHLLGAALGAGTSPVTAVLAVAEALPGPVADEFRGVHHRLFLGVEPAAAWGGLVGPLLPLGATMTRAHESGASVRDAVEHLAEDLRLGARARADGLARSVEVRASAPLGVCFLPAFVLLGIVPMTVGIFSSVRLFG